MIYIVIVFTLMIIWIIRNMLVVNSLWIQVKKNESVLSTKSSLEKNYQFIKDLH
jgi:hypothetical protein